MDWYIAYRTKAAEIKRLYFNNPVIDPLISPDHPTLLSRIIRWSGLGLARTNVCQHAVSVSKIAELIGQTYSEDDPSWTPQRIARAALIALHHDDHEAFPPLDLPTPFKRHLDCKEIDLVQARIQQAVCRDLYGFDYHQQAYGYEAVIEVVHLADRIVAYLEAQREFPNIDTIVGEVPHPEFAKKIAALPPSKLSDVEEYTSRHDMLTRRNEIAVVRNGD